jgi:hypothetical protein
MRSATADGTQAPACGKIFSMLIESFGVIILGEYTIVRISDGSDARSMRTLPKARTVSIARAAARNLSREATDISRTQALQGIAR